MDVMEVKRKEEQKNKIVKNIIMSPPHDDDTFVFVRVPHISFLVENVLRNITTHNTISDDSCCKQ